MRRFFILCTVFLLTIGVSFGLTKPRWDARPIKVYIPEHSTMSHHMKNAFLQWQTRTSSAVWFTFLSYDRRDEADITVHFVEKNTYCGSTSAIGCAHYRVNSDGFYTHNDIYIASKSVARLVGDDGTVATKTSLIPHEQVYRVMLHEIGHAIGIAGHSKNPNSVMYAYSINDENIPQRLTDEDLKFVYNVYR